MTVEVTKVNSGFDMPVIGLGTWKSDAGGVKCAVKAAVACGYRLIDCAYIYGNETYIGEALAEIFDEGSVRREDLFIISKLFFPADVKFNLQESLDRLQVKYLDLYLIHWPNPFKRGAEDNMVRDEHGALMYEDIHYIDTWKAMEQCVEEGLVRSIGLSNFNSQQIQYIIDHGRIPPAVNEIEIHPYFDQHRLVDFCKQRNIEVIAYSSFGSANLDWVEEDDKISILDDECLKSIAGRLSKTPAQVILRWLYQRRITSIPKSVTPARIQQNIQIFDFELSSTDMEAINKLNRNLRIITPYVVRNGVKVYEFANSAHYPFPPDIEF